MRSDSPRIGAHVSIAGGVQNAPLRAQEEGCETFQCFTRSPQGGPAPELTDELIRTFKENMATTDMDRFYIHAPYYINVASPDGRIRHGSIRVIREELERGSQLGARFVMFHPGSYRDQTLEEATRKVQDGLVEILDGYAGSCKLLIEISAGTGNILGDTFQEVADMLSSVKQSSGFGGVCFDTCHAFASGYDFRTPDTAASILREFDATVGLKWLKLAHVNDSKVALGERRDRHEHLGRGAIGVDGIAALLHTPEFAHIDWLLETESEGRLEDMRILRELRP